MNKVEIVREAINSLNKHKKAGLTILDIKDDGSGGVDVKVTYPKPIKYWNEKEQYYGFTKDWFRPEKIDIEDYSWMEGFEVSSSLRKSHPEQVCILRIAYYFWKHGKDEQVL